MNKTSLTTTGKQSAVCRKTLRKELFKGVLTKLKNRDITLSTRIGGRKWYAKIGGLDFYFEPSLPAPANKLLTWYQNWIIRVYFNYIRREIGRDWIAIQKEKEISTVWTAIKEPEGRLRSE